MEYIYVTRNDEVEQLLSGLAEQCFIDTEFVRVTTFYPHLGLVQLNIQDKIYLIDPLQLDRSLFHPMFKKQWVLHSSSEDLEVMSYFFKDIPAQLFDTQVAASFLNIGASIGYAALVNQLFGVIVEKDQTRTDWLARPLTSAQLNYAAMDVVFLPKIHELFSNQLKEKGKMSWFENEMCSVLTAKKTTVDLDTLYFQISNAWMLKPAELMSLKLLASWRYQTAIAEDKPVSFILKDDAMIDICRKQPATDKQLLECQLNFAQKNKYGKSILNLLSNSKGIDCSEWPEKVTRIIDYPHYKNDLKKIKQEIERVANDVAIPPELLGSKKMINQYLLAKYEPEIEMTTPIKLLSGWRGDLLNLS